MKRGLTLIEMLVAMILTTIVAFIALGLVRGEHANYTLTRQKIKLQADAREAMRIMEEEIKNSGFQIKTSIASGVLTFEKCTNALYSNGTSINTPAAGALEFRMFEGFSNFSCADDDSKLWTIGYRKNGSVLERKAKPGGATAYAGATWVPFLEGVEGFTIEYGLYGDGASSITIADLTSSNPSSLFTPANATVAVDQASSTDRPWVMSGWGITAGSVLLNKDIVLDGKSTYRVSFRAFANSTFKGTTNGVTDGAKDRFAFFRPTTGGGADLKISFDPGADGNARKIQYDISPGTSGTYHFGFTACMVAPTTAPTLTISNLSVTRLNSGEYRSWVNEATTPVPNWKNVGALRLKLKAKGKKSEVLQFERIIPVVNNVVY
jgi:prepilin-type N-terminal cleavage/methylation domain-containing protein